jgi:hypothetical protein
MHREIGREIVMTIFNLHNRIVERLCDIVTCGARKYAIAIFQVSTCCGSLFCRKLKGKRKAICFSALMSFVTAGITGAIGIDTLNRF